MLSYFRWFGQFWKHKRFTFALVLLLTVITTAVKIGFPVLLKYIIDDLSGDYNPNIVYRHITWYFIAAVVFEIFGHGLPAVRAYLNLSFAAMMRNRYFDVFSKKATRFFKRFRTGDLLTRLTDDIDGAWDRLAWYSCSGVMRPLEAVLNLGFTLAVMLHYSWQLSLVSFFPLPFLVFVLAKTEHRLVTYTTAKQQSISHCNNVLDACFSGIRVIKTTNSEQDQFAKYEQALNERVKREKDFLKVNQIIQFFSMLINNAGSIIVIFVGSWLTIKSAITIGTLFLFIQYMQRLVDPIWTLSWFYASSKSVFRYVDRLKETEDFGNLPDLQDATNPGPFNRLCLKNVSYCYEDAQEPVLKGIDLDINAGEKIAIVGQVGSGKTTLLELIAGNLAPNSGQILYNQHLLNKVDQTALAAQTGYIRQENVLFSETIEDNLHLGDRFSQQEVDRSLKISLMDKEVQEFPQRAQTKLGQRGLSLSGGQKQRLSIARTLIRKPQLLLMDDCTAAMDATTEQIFWDNLNENLPGITCLIVTHRQATARQADKVILLDKGMVAAIGKHQQLIQQHALYNRIMTRH